MFSGYSRGVELEVSGGEGHVAHFARSADRTDVSGPVFQWGSGVLKLSIGQLTNLNTLELASNQFTGSVPSSLSQLSSLIYLDLRFSRMSRSLPTYLSAMTDLVVAYVDGNRFGGRSIRPYVRRWCKET